MNGGLNGSDKIKILLIKEVCPTCNNRRKLYNSKYIPESYLSSMVFYIISQQLWFRSRFVLTKVITFNGSNQTLVDVVKVSNITKPFYVQLAPYSIFNFHIY